MVLGGVCCVKETHGHGGAPLRRRDHVRGEGLRGVDALADLLLDEVHGQSKLLPAQLPYLPGVGQRPGGCGGGEREGIRRGSGSIEDMHWVSCSVSS